MSAAFHLHLVVWFGSEVELVLGLQKSVTRVEKNSLWRLDFHRVLRHPSVLTKWILNQTGLDINPIRGRRRVVHVMGWPGLITCTKKHTQVLGICPEVYFAGEWNLANMQCIHIYTGDNINFKL